MSLSKTYYVDGDYPLDDVSSTTNVAKSILYAIYAILRGLKTGTNGPAGAPPMGALWTLEGSSDSVTAGMDATERLGGSSFDASKWVRATAGNAHSWFVLGNGTIHICVDWDGGSDTQMDLAMSKNAFTGGSNTNRPTAVGEVSTATSTMGDLTASTQRVSRICDANGFFHILVARQGAGYFHTTLATPLLLPSSLRTGDTWPNALYFEGVGSGRGVLGASGAMNSPSGAQGFMQRSPNGSGTYDPGGAGGAQPPSASNWTTATVSNQADGKYDCWPTLVFFAGSSGTVHVLRGLLADWDWVNNGKSIGDVTPASGTPERIVVGNMLVPCGGITLTL